MSIAPELIQEWSEVSPKIIQDALPGAVELLSVDRPEEALRLAELIDDETVAAWTQVQVATTVVSENPGLARSVAESLDSPGSKSAVLVALARVAMK